MNIQLFNDRIAAESQILQRCMRLRQLLPAERLVCLEDLISGQQTILAQAVAERQEFFDNPNRLYWRPCTLLNPHMRHFTQLRYLPFLVCKPDLDVALFAVISDCGTDIRQMIESYGSVKVWLTVQVRYEPANPKDEKNEPFEFYLTCAATRFFSREPTVGGDGAPYAEPLCELFNQINKLNATFIREQSGLVLAGILQLVIRDVRYIPLAGRCHRKLPPYLKAKRRSSIFRIRMIGVSVMVFCGFETHLAITETISVQHYTQNKCLNVMS